jgi:hypothetical protein
MPSSFPSSCGRLAPASDNSGSHDTINNDDSTTGVQRLTAATQWLQNHHLRGFLKRPMEWALLNCK